MCGINNSQTSSIMKCRLGEISQLLATKASEYEVYSIATASSTPPYTLTIHLLHSIKHQLTKCTSRRVRNTSPKTRGPDRLQLLRGIFDLYNIVRSTIRSHDPFSTLHIEDNHRNAIADVYGATPQATNFYEEPVPLHPPAELCESVVVLAARQ